MHSSFKMWLIKDSDKWTPEEKRNFLRMTKSEPDKVVQIIASNLMGWWTVFCAQIQVGEAVVSYDIIADANELLAAYREHFASELAAMP